MSAMMLQIFRDVLECQLARILAAPVGQAGADGLGVLESGNIVAAIAPVLGDRLATDVTELLRQQVRTAANHELLFGSLQVRLISRWNAALQEFVSLGRKRLFEVFEHQGVQIVYSSWNV